MPNLKDPAIVQLLSLFEPYLFFDPMERLFPVVAEEWLDHQATEKWTASVTHQRGTAALIVQNAATSFGSTDVKAGSDAPSGSALQLASTPPNGIGQPFTFDPSTQDLFLDCAGWDDTLSEVSAGDPAFTSGSIDYLDKLFRGLANVMNPSIPTASPDPAPKFDFARSTSPSIYAELEWAGRYPMLDQQRSKQTGDMPDFPNSIGNQNPSQPGPLSALNNYLVLNYYLFYPAMETSPVAAANPDVSRIREGQWEAISIFLKGDPDFGTTDPNGRPDFPFTIVPPNLGEQGQTLRIRGLTPRFAVYSQGYKLGDDNLAPLDAEVRPWVDPLSRSSREVEKFITNPLAYVSAGTHKNFFSVVATVTTGQSQPDPALNTTGGVTTGAAGTLAGVCLGLLAAPTPITWAACVVCLIVAAVIFLIGLILFLLSFLFHTDPPVTESPQSSQPGTDVARDGGPAATPQGSGTLSGPPGLPPTAVVPITLRLISRYGFDTTPPVSTYPLPSSGVVEMPSWWIFPGRWGVRVMNRASGQWDSGTRRVDAFERSRGYWNAYQLVQFLGDPERATDGITA
jgi:hypothetical protein